MDTMLQYPPPHYILFEPLNDVETQKAWNDYKILHAKECEFAEIDAAEINTVETFSPWFYNWISQVAARQEMRIRVLMVYHSEFLTFSCQQMIRRSLEERSFKCRVWFHVEDPTTIQPAIQSRCIVKRMPTNIHKPIIKQL
jgi:DNA polymerase III delta prime subunit